MAPSDSIFTAAHLHRAFNCIRLKSTTQQLSVCAAGLEPGQASNFRTRNQRGHCTKLQTISGKFFGKFLLQIIFSHVEIVDLSKVGQRRSHP